MFSKFFGKLCKGFVILSTRAFLRTFSKRKIFGETAKYKVVQIKYFSEAKIT